MTTVAFRNIRLFLRQLEGLYNFQGFVKDDMGITMAMVRHMLRENSPVGYPPEGKGAKPYGINPSERTGHKAIKGAWISRFEVGDSPGEISMQFLNLSEHILPVVKGAIGHRIPRAGFTKLVFFWGDTVKPESGWGPKGNPKHSGKPQGIRRFKWVDHPGIQNPNPFVSKVASGSRDFIRSGVSSVTKRYIRDVIALAGLEEVFK